MNDEDLMKAYYACDNDAFDKLYCRYQEQLKRFIYYSPKLPRSLPA